VERVKSRQFLRYRNLHVMPGNAFVIRGGLVVEHVVGRVVIVDDPDLAGPRSVGCARTVLRGALLLHVGRDVGHDELGLGQEPEEFRQLRLHLTDKVRKAVQDLLARCAVHFWIGVDGLLEARSIRISGALRERRDADRVRNCLMCASE
jgi:hypothetical protein